MEYSALDDPSLADDLIKEARDILGQLDTIEIEMLFAGEFDSNDAFLSLQAGAGGTEAQAWGGMLLKMYLRWAEQHGFKVDVVYHNPGIGGVKTIELIVKGEYAYGYLKAEKGLHRLTRHSPYSAQDKLHTSFIKVEVLPILPTQAVQLNMADVRIDTYCAGGPGGQNMQKNANAVRVTHIPTQITVTCQDERSQLRNKEIALQVLYARLMERSQEQQKQKENELRGEYLNHKKGNPIRSYIWQDHYVKDHRTKLVIPNLDAVLDGEIDSFILAYLKESAAP